MNISQTLTKEQLIQKQFILFSRRLQKLRENHQDKNHLFEYLKLTKAERQLILDTSAFSQPYTEASFIKQLSQVLQLLCLVDYSGISCLVIQIYNLNSAISNFEIIDIIMKLNSLDNLAELRVIEENSSEPQSPFTQYLFSTYEPVVPSQIFSYESHSTSFQLHVTCQFHKSKKSKNHKLIHTFELSIEEQHSFSLSDFSKHLQKLYSVADNQRMAETSGKYSLLPQYYSKKKIMFTLNVSNEKLYSQIISASELFRIWEFDRNRIKAVQFTLENCSEQKLIYSNNSKNKIGNEMIVLNRYNAIELFNRTYFNYPSVHLHQMDLFTQVVRSTKGISTSVPKNLPNDIDLITQLVQVIKREYSNGQCDNLRNISLSNVNWKQVTQLLELGLSISKLKRLQIGVVYPVSHFNLNDHQALLVKLIRKLREFSISNRIEFKKDTLSLQQYDWEEEFIVFAKAFPQMIVSIQKSIRLHIDFVSHANNVHGLFRLIKQSIGMPLVTRVSLESSEDYPELYEMLKQRNSLYNQISAFSHVFADQTLIRDPKRILQDLFF